MAHILVSVHNGHFYLGATGCTAISVSFMQDTNTPKQK